MKNEVTVAILQYAKKEKARVFDAWGVYPTHTDEGKENLAQMQAALIRQGFTTRVVGSTLYN